MGLIMRSGLTFSLLSPSAVPPSSSKLRGVYQHTWHNAIPNIPSGSYHQLLLPNPILHNIKKLNSY